MDEIDLLRSRRIEPEPDPGEEARVLRLVMERLGGPATSSAEDTSRSPDPAPGVVPTLPTRRLSRQIPGPVLAVVVAVAVVAVGLVTRMLVPPSVGVPVIDSPEEALSQTSAPSAEADEFAPAISVVGQPATLPSPPDGAARPTAVAHGGNGFVAFGITNSARTVLWTSSGGESWSATGLDDSVFPPGAVVQEVRSWKEGYVAFGSQAEKPGFNASQQLFAWTSPDGVEWQRHELDVPSEAAEGPVFLRVIPQSLATGEGGILIGARTMLELDHEEVLADLFSDGPDIRSPDLSITTDYLLGTVVVINEETSQVILQTTFEDLGMDMYQFEDHQWRGTWRDIHWHSTDGKNWERLDPERDLPPRTDFLDLEAWEGGFAALGFETRGEHPNSSALTRLWTSQDGANWVQADIERWQIGPQGVVATDDTLVVYGRGVDRGVILASPDAEIWEITTLDITDIDRWQVIDATAGPSGVALVAGLADQTSGPRPSEVWWSLSGREWERWPLDIDLGNTFEFKVSIGNDTLVIVSSVEDDETITRSVYWTVQLND